MSLWVWAYFCGLQCRVPPGEPLAGYKPWLAGSCIDRDVSFINHFRPSAQGDSLQYNKNYCLLVDICNSCFKYTNFTVSTLREPYWRGCVNLHTCLYIKSLQNLHLFHQIIFNHLSYPHVAPANAKIHAYPHPSSTSQAVAGFSMNLLTRLWLDSRYLNCLAFSRPWDST